MGLHVAAVDLGPEKMALARKLGAEIAIDAKTQDPPKEIQKQIGGAHGALARPFHRSPSNKRSACFVVAARVC